MARAQNPNIEILEIAVRALGPVCDDLVFLGGCATALLISDPAAPPVRATRDIDTITETTSIAEYHELGRRLRDLLEDTRFREALAGHLPGDPGSQARLPNLVARLERLAAIQAD
jgi:hypothetical protein